MLIEKSGYAGGAVGTALRGDIISALEGCELFGKTPLLERLISDERFTVNSYISGETVYDRENYSTSLGIVIKGCALVYKGTDAKRVMIDEKGRSDSFGAAALFGEVERYASHIVAKGKDTVIAFIPQELMRELIASDGEIAVRYIEFLSGKVRYLNQKLDIYAGTTPGDKVIAYISARGGECEINMQKLAGELDIGRATLYRTVEKLEEERIILREGKKIKIINKN